jgi:hypothetical protein
MYPVNIAGFQSEIERSVSESQVQKGRSEGKAIIAANPTAGVTGIKISSGAVSTVSKI